MTTYYKATRPDGFSFKGSPCVEYRVGATVTPAFTVAEPAICGEGLLHAADVPAATLVGGSWPCRLFEVEGEPVVGFDAANPRKGGFLSLTVVREIEAWQALGPNGREIVAFLARLPALTAPQWAARAAAWDAAWAAANAARDAANAAGDAANAAGDAALALCARDLITPEQFATLYTPFAEAIPVESLVPQ